MIARTILDVWSWLHPGGDSPGQVEAGDVGPHDGRVEKGDAIFAPQGDPGHFQQDLVAVEAGVEEDEVGLVGRVSTVDLPGVEMEDVHPGPLEAHGQFDADGAGPDKGDGGGLGFAGLFGGHGSEFLGRCWTLSGW